MRFRFERDADRYRCDVVAEDRGEFVWFVGEQIKPFDEPKIDHRESVVTCGRGCVSSTSTRAIVRV